MTVAAEWYGIRMGLTMRLSYRSSENTLRLTLDQESGEVVRTEHIDGCIDIAEQGRLVGIELQGDGISLADAFSTWLEDGVARDYVELEGDDAYVALSAPHEEFSPQHIRTADLQIRAELDRDDHLVALAIPRRGHGYEISFPSGNR